MLRSILNNAVLVFSLFALFFFNCSNSKQKEKFSQAIEQFMTMQGTTDNGQAWNIEKMEFLDVKKGKQPDTWFVKTLIKAKGQNFGKNEISPEPLINDTISFSIRKLSNEYYEVYEMNGIRIE